MSGTFQCSNCGASLEYKERDGSTVKCPYCNSTVIVPETLRKQSGGTPQISVSYGTMDPESVQKVRDVVANASTRTSTGAGCGAILSILGAIAGLAVGLIAIVQPSMLENAIDLVIDQVEENTDVEVIKTTDEEGTSFSFGDLGGSGDGFATEILSFGTEGTGVGNFDDARHIAVDGDGNIYVGEYTSTRIQVFDPEGKFITQFALDDEYMLAVDVARDGTVYAVQGGIIYMIDGATGERKGTLLNTFDYYAEDVYVLPDGRLLVAARGLSADEQILIMSNTGAIEQTINDPIEAASGENSDISHVTADGQVKMIYAFATFTEGIFAFRVDDGGFSDRFGGEGDGPGQFRVTTDIDVDGQGRIYVSDPFNGIVIFNPDGSYLRSVEVKGSNDGISIDDAGRLYVAVRDHVVVYELNWDQ